MSRSPLPSSEQDDERTVVDAASAPRPRNTELELVAVFAALESKPREHDFFAVLRRIENLQPARPRFGKALRPSQEAVRLGQEPDLDFAPAAIERFDPGRRAPRLGTRFFGLLGPQGPMPLHFTEHVRERARSRNDPTTARFLDLFHHRLLSLFYRAWAEHQPTVQHDRPAEDRYAEWLGASFGREARPPVPRALPDAARLFQAGLLGARSRHPEGLAKLIGQHFRVPVRIEEHILHWLVPDEADRMPLGFSRSRPERVGQRSAQLGVSATSGRRWRDRNSKFRVVIGPLSCADHERFLPDGRAWRGVAEWVRQYAGLDLRWDLQLVLAGAHVPEPRLGRRVRLGVTSWLGRDPARRDRGDLRLRPDTSSLLLLPRARARANGVPHA